MPVGTLYIYNDDVYRGFASGKYTNKIAVHRDADIRQGRWLISTLKRYA